jgi:hypothetical protein
MYETGQGGGWIIAVTTVAISSVGALLFTDWKNPWMIGFALYIVLVLIYLPPEAYGLSVASYDTRRLEIFALLLFVLILQLGTLELIKLIRRPETKRTCLFAVVSHCALYVLQFLVTPLIYERVFGGGNEGIAIIIVILASSIPVCIVYALTVSDKTGIWLKGFALYIALLLIYAPQAAYSIGVLGVLLMGYYDPSLRFFGIMIVVIYVLLLQWGTLGLTKLIKRQRQKRKGRFSG